MTEPQPRMPAATAPWNASGAAAMVMRAAGPLGTSPCSAIATRVASSTRRCASFGLRPVTSRKKWSVKETVPIRSAQRSKPRTMIVSALAALIAVCGSFCEPIFTRPSPPWCALSLAFFSPSEVYFALRKLPERAAMSSDRPAAPKDASDDAAEDKEFVDALARGLAVIECFDDAHAQLSLSEVARLAKLTPATARRNLHTLVKLGYLCKVDNRFLLSARVLTLGSGYLRAAHVDDALMPELRRIVG